MPKQLRTVSTTRGSGAVLVPIPVPEPDIRWPERRTMTGSGFIDRFRHIHVEDGWHIRYFHKLQHRVSVMDAEHVARIELDVATGGDLRCSEPVRCDRDAHVNLTGPPAVLRLELFQCVRGCSAEQFGQPQQRSQHGRPCMLSRRCVTEVVGGSAERSGGE